jgi:hypothetical protein
VSLWLLICAKKQPQRHRDTEVAQRRIQTPPKSLN